MKSELHVQLLLPDSVLAQAGEPDAPALKRLLRQARRVGHFVGDAEAWRCRFFNVDRQQDWPMAPFACVADGLDPGDDYWLCANPVHLLLMRDSFTVTDGAAGKLDLAQAQQLTQALNTHFAADGLRFVAPQHDRWYLRLERPPAMQTTPLSAILGRDMQKGLPRGVDALEWHAWLNEIQMLLHGQALNLELEQRGQPAVNSVWLWGGGVRPACLLQPVSVWAQDPATRGLAVAHGGTGELLPASAKGWLKQNRLSGQHLFVLDRTREESPQAALQRLDDAWFAPLLQALRQGIVASVTLHLALEAQVNSFSLSRFDLRKFWRRQRPLGDYLG